MEKKLKIRVEPTIITIFGATGELNRTRILPALFELYRHKMLPKMFYIVGFARSEFSHEEFREKIKLDGDKKLWKKFAKNIYYVPGNFTSHEDFFKLSKQLQQIEGRGHSCANRLFVYATLPSHFETISHELKRTGLLIGCAMHKRQTRVIVEKPFGSDLRSAQKLDMVLDQYFKEEQIYRIDHYLGKEAVQNLIAFRFANTIFEPVWNREYVDHIQISSLEDTGIGNRGAYYEEAGVLRDMMQNHMMQLLAVTAMEIPAEQIPDATRDERAKVIRAIRKPKEKDLQTDLVVGQYKNYRAEPNVSPHSKIETYAAVKLFVDNPRWEGVPFYLRTGKQLRKKIAEISIVFKEPLGHLFDNHDEPPNVLTFQIQPGESIDLAFLVKDPGFVTQLRPLAIDLPYAKNLSNEIPGAYERLLLNFMQGDQGLFARMDEIENAWKYIDVLAAHLRHSHKQPREYEQRSWGPKQADNLINKDKRQWLIR